MSADIVWEDPPEQAQGRHGSLLPFVAELKKHPGKWAISRAGGATAQSFASTRESLKRKECEATIRKQPDGTYTLYARWSEVAS